jgi:hypothetical protein
MVEVDSQRVGIGVKPRVAMRAISTDVLVALARRLAVDLDARL